ncbi:hypothetical protein [Streptomyces sp. NPDC002644]
MLFPVAGPDTTERRADAAPADAVARGAAAVSMRDLLASCAAAHAVSSPPSPDRPAADPRATPATRTTREAA